LSGDQALAHEHYETGLKLADQSAELPMMAFRQPHAFFRHPQARATLARTLWLRGQVDRAVRVAREVIDEGATIERPVEKCSLLILCEAVFVWRGEWDDAGHVVDVLTKHVERYSLASHRGMAVALRGELLVRTGRPKEGCSLLQEAAGLLEVARNSSLDTAFAGALAEGLAATGALDEALGTIERALVEAKRRGGTWDMPELLRLKGVLLASMSSTDVRAAEGAMSSAISLARCQGALAWELRATTSLTRERLRRGAAVDGLRDLSTVYAKFTEGLETPDLQAARVLLERRADREKLTAPVRARVAPLSSDVKRGARARASGRTGTRHR
jgi:hypothetical protein